MKINRNSFKVSSTTYYDRFIKKMALLTKEEETAIFLTFVKLKKQVIELLLGNNEIFNNFKNSAFTYLDNDNILDFFYFDIDFVENSTVDELVEYYTDSLTSLLSSDNYSSVIDDMSALHYTNEIYELVLNLSSKELKSNSGADPIINSIDAIKNRVIERNLAMPIEIALNYKNIIEIPLDDAIQMAIIGLSSSIDKFNPFMRTKLSTSAYYWIFQSIQRYNDTHAELINIPNNIIIQNKKNSKIISKLLNDKKEYPTVDEICEESGNNSYIICNNKFDPFESRVSIKNDDLTLSDVLKDESIIEQSKEIEHNTLMMKIKNLVNFLDNKEKIIIEMTCGWGNYDKEYSNKDIMSKLNIDNYSFNKIKKSALTKIKDIIETDSSFNNWREILDEVI